MLVWCIFILITFSGQPHPDMVWDIPYPFDPDSFIEPGVSAHIRSPHLLHGKLLDLFECLRGTLLETHSMDTFVHVIGVFTSSLMAERPFSCHPSSWEPFCWDQAGKEECEVSSYFNNISFVK